MTVKPIPWFDVGNIGGRSSPMTALVHAAYLSAEVLVDDDGVQWEQPSNADKVLHSAFMLPASAQADWQADREGFWNALDAHARAKRKDARRAKTIMVAFPYELPATAYQVFCERMAAPFLAQGIGVEAAVHDDGKNPHCHLMLANFAYADGQFEKNGQRSFQSKKFLFDQEQRACTILTELLAEDGIDLTIVPRNKANAKGKGEKQQHRGPQAAERATSRQRAAKKRDKERQQTGATEGQRDMTKEDEPERGRSENKILARAREVKVAPKAEADSLPQSAQPTKFERAEYPNLAQIKQWPPTADMDRNTLTVPQRRELEKYLQHQATQDKPSLYAIAKEQFDGLISWIKPERAAALPYDHPDNIATRKFEHWRKTIRSLKDHPNPNVRKYYWEVNRNFKAYEKATEKREKFLSALSPEEREWELRSTDFREVRKLGLGPSIDTFLQGVDRLEADRIRKMVNESHSLFADYAEHFAPDNKHSSQPHITQEEWEKRQQEASDPEDLALIDRLEEDNQQKWDAVAEELTQEEAIRQTARPKR